ncbi:MAG: proteasome subunit alpha [Chthoniobacterales bacterium]
MIEEPYRWVEAIANRREYIETQLASGSPIVAVSCNDGILFVTMGSGRQKIFEIYDRIAMGAIGHPGDIERLRMAAIELASTEGFTRSAADVSLRRLAHYSLSPVMKTAFEQVYGAPYLARLLFAEIGPTVEQDLFLRLDCDGSIASAGAGRDPFGAISGTREATQAIETHLRAEHRADSTFAASLEVALDAWAAAQIVNTDTKQAPSREQITKERAERSQNSSVEAALLERSNERAIRYRQLTADEIRSATGG